MHRTTRRSFVPFLVAVTLAVTGCGGSGSGSGSSDDAATGSADASRDTSGIAEEAWIGRISLECRQGDAKTRRVLEAAKTVQQRVLALRSVADTLDEFAAFVRSAPAPDDVDPAAYVEAILAFRAANLRFAEVYGSAPQSAAAQEAARELEAAGDELTDAATALGLPAETCGVS